MIHTIEYYSEITRKKLSRYKRHKGNNYTLNMYMVAGFCIEVGLVDSIVEHLMKSYGSEYYLNKTLKK